MTHEEFIRDYLPKGNCPTVLLGEHCDSLKWAARCRYYHRAYGHRNACRKCWEGWITRLRKEDIPVEIFAEEEE